MSLRDVATRWRHDIRLLLGLLMLLLLTVCRAEPPLYQVPRMAVPPVLDGVLSPHEWDSAPPATLRLSIPQYRLHPRRVSRHLSAGV